MVLCAIAQSASSERCSMAASSSWTAWGRSGSGAGGRLLASVRMTTAPTDWAAAWARCSSWVYSSSGTSMVRVVIRSLFLRRLLNLGDLAPEAERRIHALQPHLLPATYAARLGNACGRPAPLEMYAFYLIIGQFVTSCERLIDSSTLSITSINRYPVVMLSTFCNAA